MRPEDLIKVFIRDLGISIEDIPTVDEELTPDFILNDASSIYLLELKTKYSNPDKQILKEESFNMGILHETTESILPQNRLSGIIAHAKEQLDNAAKKDEVFRLLWLFVDSSVAEAHFEQFESTLYGSTSLVDWGEDRKSGTVFYFYNSDFYRYKDSIDAAFISNRKELKFCLNSYSPRYKRLKSTQLFLNLPGGIIDPLELEANGTGFIADTNIDRKERSAVTKYVVEKYNLSDLTRIMDMKAYSGTVQVNLDEETIINNV